MFKLSIILQASKDFACKRESCVWRVSKGNVDPVILTRTHDYNIMQQSRTCWRRVSIAMVGKGSMTTLKSPTKHAKNGAATARKLYYLLHRYCFVLLHILHGEPKRFRLEPKRLEAVHELHGK